MRRENVTAIPGSNINLPCRPRTNLAQVRWNHSGQPLPASPRYYTYGEGLMILNATPSDSGAYTCLSEERVKGRLYVRPEVEYRVVPGAGEGTLPRVLTQIGGGSHAALQVSVAVLSLLLAALLAWNVYRGHIPVPCWGGRGAEHRRAPGPGPAQRGPPQLDPGAPNQAGGNCLEDKPLMPTVNYSSNNNRPVANASSNGEGTLSPRLTIDTFKYIDDESEI